MTTRRLTSTERRVGDADRPRYDRAWDRVRGAAGEVGARAWRFQSAREPTLYVEFLEWSGSDPRQAGDFPAALRALQEFGPGDTKEWLEPSISIPDSTKR